MRHLRAFAVSVGLAMTGGVLAGCLIGIDDSLVDRMMEGAGDDASAGSDGGSTSTNGDSSSNPPDDSDLLGLWTFEEAAGLTTVMDLSGHGHHGTLSTPSVLATPGAAGTGQALRLNGGQLFDVAKLNGVAFPRIGTLSFWFRSTGEGMIGVASWGIFDVQNSGRKHVTMGPLYVGMSKYTVIFDGDAQTKVNFDATTGTWHHVVIAWDPDASSASITVDNVVTDATIAPGSIGTSQLFRFGTAFVGDLDEIRLYGRRLSPKEIADLP